VRRRLFLALAIVGLAALAGCRGPVRPYESLAPHAANLREQFNKDGGTVRIVILPAPT
jgi:hypothetical protein